MVRKKPENAYHSQKEVGTLRLLVLGHPGWALSAILLIAFNMRPALTSVAPLLQEIRSSYELSGFWTSVLTTVPVICLGLFGPLAPALARRFGNEAVILFALLGIVAGSTVRSLGVAPLYIGTVLIGASMSFLGILAPVVIKRDFPHKIGRVMGLYVMFISLGAAVSTAATIPIRGMVGGWRFALMTWALPVILAAVVFIPQLFRNMVARPPADRRAASIMGDGVAWQVTGFLALVSSLAYSVFMWGPSMLEGRGLDPASSGALVSISYLAQMVSGLFVPVVAARLRQQSIIAAIVVSLTVVGLLGFIFAPLWSLSLFSITLGLGQGGAFGLAMLLIVLRSGEPHIAVQLSSMAQTIGYIAGGLVGPFAVGIIHNLSGSWNIVAAFYVVIGFCTLVVGLAAGRALTVQPRGATGTYKAS